MVENKLFGLGTIARRVGISREGVRRHLLAGNVPEPALRAPNGSRLFTLQEADAVVDALRMVRGARK